MAYKNKKKNKIHVMKVHEKLRSKKCAREKNRNHPAKELTQLECEKLLRQEGLI